MYTGMILIDLQKAFDTIHHKILLAKLLPTGFSKNTISWCESYFGERYFTVESDGFQKSGFKIRKYFMRCSARFNFRPSTIFD